jgi:hypothetical protein
MGKGGRFSHGLAERSNPYTRFFGVYVKVECRVDRVGPPGILAAVHTKRAGAHG